MRVGCVFGRNDFYDFWHHVGVLKSQKTLVDFANTTNVEFIVDAKVLFHGCLIYSYLHMS